MSKSESERAIKRLAIKTDFRIKFQFSYYIKSRAFVYLNNDAYDCFINKYFNESYLIIREKYINGFANYAGTVIELFSEIAHEFDMTGNISIFESEVEG